MWHLTQWADLAHVYSVTASHAKILGLIPAAHTIIGTGGTVPGGQGFGITVEEESSLITLLVSWIHAVGALFYTQPRMWYRRDPDYSINLSLHRNHGLPYLP